VLRGRAGAEGPRRAADGCRRSCEPDRWRGHAASLGRGIRSLGCGGVSLNTLRPGVALAPGSGSHLPWAVPGGSKIARTPFACFTYANTRRLPPHLTQVNTSTANVLRSSPAQSPGGVLFPPLLPRPCLRRHARLLCSYLGARHAPLLRTCLGERAWLAPGRTPWRTCCTGTRWHSLSPWSASARRCSASVTASSTPERRAEPA
jgi:hypothetical protein